MLQTCLRTPYRQWLSVALGCWLGFAAITLPILSGFADRYARDLTETWTGDIEALVLARVRPALLAGRLAGLENALAPLTGLPLLDAVQVYSVDDELLAAVRRADALPPLSAARATVREVVGQGTLLGFVRLEYALSEVVARTGARFRWLWFSLLAPTAVLLLGGAAVGAWRQDRRLGALRARARLLAGPDAGEGPDPLADLERWLPELPAAEPEPGPSAPGSLPVTNPAEPPGLVLDVLLADPGALSQASRTEIIALIASRARAVTDVYGGTSATLPGRGVRLQLPDDGGEGRGQALCAAWVLRALVTGRDRFDADAPVTLHLLPWTAAEAEPAPGGVPAGTIAVDGSLWDDRLPLDQLEAEDLDPATTLVYEVRGALRTRLTRQFQSLNRSA